jgi:hypothetical protein
MSPTPHLSRRGLLAAGAASAALPLLAPSVASARPASEVRRAPYTFRNAEIVGGGFVTGIVFNQREPGLVYARTDIGGAYRLDTAFRRWLPLTDWIGWDEYGHTGIISIATDEVNPDRVYLAAGTYTLPDWDPTMTSASPPTTATPGRPRAVSRPASPDPESTTRPSPSAPTAGGSSCHRRELRPAGPTTTEPPGRRRRGCRPGFRCAPTG